MSDEQTRSARKVLLIEKKVHEAILRLLFGNLPERATGTSGYPRVLFHLLENRKAFFGREFSKSRRLEIISPVPNTVKSQNVIKVSAKSGNQFSPLGSNAELNLEKKSETLKCFQSRKKKGEK